MKEWWNRFARRCQKYLNIGEQTDVPAGGGDEVRALWPGKCRRCVDRDGGRAGTSTALPAWKQVHQRTAKPGQQRARHLRRQPS